MSVRVAFACPLGCRYRSLLSTVLLLVTSGLSSLIGVFRGDAAVHAADDAADDAAVSRPVSFIRDIRPILAKHCFACHGPDEGTREAKLRLDQQAGATGPREGGAAFVPGKPAASVALARVVSADPEQRMPPPEAGPPLTAGQIDLLRRWVAQGAPWQSHWAFEKIARPQLPAVRDATWSRNAIDRFILERLEQEGLRPAPAADPAVLARRVALDLTGLPPSPELSREYLADPTDAAYERLVDRLLESKTYGERWARVWLDLARYADTRGYEKDRTRIIWRYRDWVIDAFNADLPYDQFTRDQLAGDLLPAPTMEQLLATALHRNTMVNEEGGTDDEEFRVAAVKDRVDTTVQVWMGLTMGCGKCHSHKYDPISQREYYQFFAFFNQTEDSDKGDERPVAPTPTADQQRQLGELRDRLARLEDVARTAPQTAELRGKIAAVQEQIRAVRPVETPILRELPSDKRRVTKIHVRGNFLEPGDTVQAAVPASFHPLPADSPPNRLGVAAWLCSPDNPLTARVAANRLWSQLLGNGLVETQEDFGSQGQPPSHPELLDWLAAEFMQPAAPGKPWSWKALCKTIVMSATYRQSSRVAPELAERDRFNRLYARGARFRLDAETLRDNALAASGLLSSKMYGPSVMPPQPDGIWRSTYNTDKWVTSAGEDRYRRGLYTFVKRTSPYPAMTTFDAPSREICTIRRSRTNTPLQSLVTLNDPAFVECAQALARRAWKESEAATPGDRIARAIELTLIRTPRPAEVATLVALYGRRLEEFRADNAAAKRFATEPLGPAPDGVEIAELAALAAVCNVILNLDEFLTRG